MIGEIDLDFVFLITVHCMLQSSGGSDVPQASSVQRSRYPSPLAKRHCHRIEEPSGQGSGGDGPSHRAPSPPPLQGHAEEPLRFSERTMASGKVWFRCPFYPDAMETDNMYRLIEHALNFNPDDPLVEQHHRLARQHLHGDEEEEDAEAEYDDFSDDTSEEGDG